MYPTVRNICVVLLTQLLSTLLSASDRNPRIDLLYI
jgi:hypothetical protein